MHSKNWCKQSMAVFFLTALMGIFSFPGQGISATFVSGLAAPTGLAIHPQKRLLYVKSGAGGTVWKIPILAGGKAGPVAVVTDQFPPSSDIKFDAQGNLFGISHDNSYTYIYRLDSAGTVCYAYAYHSPASPGIAVEAPGLSSSRLFFQMGGYYLWSMTISTYACNSGLDPDYINNTCGSFGFLLHRPSRADLVGSLGSVVSSINMTNGQCTTLIPNLAQPAGLAEDSLGNLYVADSGAGAIYKRTPTGTVTKIVQGLSSPTGLVYDAPNGFLYVAETGANRISYWPAGIAISGGIYLSVRSSTGTWANAVKLPGSIKTPSSPAAVFDDKGNLYVFVQGADNAVWMIKRNTSKVWGAWAKVPNASTMSGPTAASAGNTIYLYRRGLDDALYLATLSSTGTWSAWTKVPGSLPTPTGSEAAEDSAGNQYLFFRGMK
jgi:sugar lactone lactonase YvrE